jgi:hypothetical protein
MAVGTRSVDDTKVATSFSGRGNRSVGIDRWRTDSHEVYLFYM